MIMIAFRSVSLTCHPVNDLILHKNPSKKKKSEKAADLIFSSSSMSLLKYHVVLA